MGLDTRKGGGGGILQFPAPGSVTYQQGPPRDPFPSPSPSTLAPNRLCPGNLAVRECPITPLLGGDSGRVARLRSQLGSERSRHRSEERSGEAPAKGRALGQGSSSPEPARGAWSREPRRAKAKVSGFPPPARLELQSRPPTLPRRRALSPQQGFHSGKGSPPHRAGPRPLPDPQTHPLQGTGGPRRPAAARQRPPAEARPPPPARPRRPWLRERGVRMDQSARRRPEGCMLQSSRPRGAGGRASFSSTRAAQGPQPPPGRVLETAPGGVRGLRRCKSGSAARWRRPRLRATAARAPSRDLRAPSPALRPCLPALGPERSGAQIFGRANKRTRGQTDARTGGRAPGQAGGERAAGARAARPVNNAARQLGPVRAAGKGGADPDSEGTRRPGEARDG